MVKLEEALPNYLRILEGKQKPRFKSAGHARLYEKIETSFKILESCELCERKCHVNRKENELGFCKVPAESSLASYFTHMGEEFFFVPSFTIFFWSCTFRCHYCQNWTISQGVETPKRVTEEMLAKIIDAHNNCRNINFVGGEPTMYLPFIIKTLAHVKSDTAVVWNSNFYMSEKSMELLRGIVDVYLSDFKYGNDRCAEKLSEVKNYTEIIKRNHLMAKRDSELVIRHLMLPGHFECCTKPVLDFIADNFGKKVILNIMPQYMPHYRASEHSEINRMLKEKEFEMAVRYVKGLDLNFIT